MNHVPPPDAAVSPNIPPGRRFFDRAAMDDDCDEPVVALPLPVTPDLSKPNTTRLLIADQLFTLYVAQGQDPVTARANADARALAMVP